MFNVIPALKLSCRDMYMEKPNLTCTRASDLGAGGREGNFIKLSSGLRACVTWAADAWGRKVNDELCGIDIAHKYYWV